MAAVETDANICGAKGSTQGLRRVQDFVALICQLLPEKSKEPRCVNCSCRKCVPWPQLLSGRELTECAPARLPWLFLLWIRESLENRTCDPEKQELKIHQHNEAAYCFI